MIISVIGPSGSGKGSLAAYLEREHGFHVVATGQLFRRHLQDATDLGRAASTYLRNGELVPGEIVKAMIEEELVQIDGRLVIDGMPRTADQARFLDTFLEERGRCLRAVFYLDAKAEIVEERLVGRLVCSHCHETYHRTHRPPRNSDVGLCDACGSPLQRRPEDVPDLIRLRLRNFRLGAEDVLDYYQHDGRLRLVDAEQPLAAVQSEVADLLTELFEDRLIGSSSLAIGKLLAELRPAAAAPVTADQANYVLLGGPGSGKGTQAVALSEKLRIPHVSTGDIFRRNLADETELGKLARSYMERGALVPNDVTEAMVQDRLRHADANEGFLLDGFPRNRTQARALTQILAEGGSALRGVVYLEVGDDEIVRRLSGRLTCRDCQASYHRDFKPPSSAGICDSCRGELYQRADDNPDSIRARLATFHHETTPVIDYYRSARKLIAVDGEGSPDQVWQRVLAVVDEAESASHS